MMNPKVRWSITAGLTAMSVFGGICTPPQPAHAQASQVARTNMVIPIDEDVAGPDFNVYTVSGFLQVRFQAVRDGAGRLHLTGHANNRGVTVSSDFATYTLTGSSNLVANVNNPTRAASTFQGLLNYGLVDRGRLTSYRVLINLHGTIHPNGRVTVQFGQVDFSER